MCTEQALEDRAVKLQLEFGRVTNDLRQELENYRQAESLRKAAGGRDPRDHREARGERTVGNCEGCRRTDAQLATRVRYAMLLLSARSPLHSRAPHENDTTQAAYAQVRELEAELENEQRKSRDALGAACYEYLNSRRTRLHLQLQVQIEEEKCLSAELQDLLDKTQLKLKQYKRQVDEAVRASRTRASLGNSLSLH